MKTFKGGFVAHAGGDPVTASILVDGEWVRIVAGHRRLGAWPLNQVACERVTVFRFLLRLENEEFTFAPDDPRGFSEAMGAVVDLRPRARFGLGDRVKAARAAQAMGVNN
jgi:hypothetical protein